jgi:hypothetical protein
MKSFKLIKVFYTLLITDSSMKTFFDPLLTKTFLKEKT